MDTARQLIRWSIPGSIYLLWVGFCFLSYYFFAHIFPANNGYVDAFNRLNKIPISLLVASSIPIGFIIYQIYFWFFGNALPKLNLVSLDRGAIVICDIDCRKINELCALQSRFTEHERDIDMSFIETRMYDPVTFKFEWLNKVTPSFYKLKKEYQNRDGRLLYKQNFFGFWDVVRYYLKSNECIEQIEEEYTSHFDIYHALGAARWAIFLGYISFLLLVLSFLVFTKKVNVIDIITFNSIVLNLLYLLMTLFIIKILSTNRTVTLYSIISLIKHVFNQKTKNKCEQSH